MGRATPPQRPETRSGRTLRQQWPSRSPKTPRPSPRRHPPDAEVDTVAAAAARIDACASADGYRDSECGRRDDSGWITPLPDDTPWTLEPYPSVEVEPDYQGGLEVFKPGSHVAGDGGGRDAHRYHLGLANGTVILGDGGALVFEPQACDLGASYC
ncbi:hypothetical protein GALLR39Z86_13630 [Glycomyces algeriensis]|uniref:Uncharacterized protein n=1 Tax=Glycomyces algeriensis TaxID=256037 RepID=A0A9W6G774_9ACTN|nr:hypothetical protein GALLR39Z86_13630 [Glycomyces algeriensis]